MIDQAIVIIIKRNALNIGKMGITLENGGNGVGFERPHQRRQGLRLQVDEVFQFRTQQRLLIGGVATVDQPRQRDAEDQNQSQKWQ